MILSIIRLPEENVPRWVVFLADLIICFLSLIIAYVVRFDTADIPFDAEYAIFMQGLPIYLGIRGITFLIFRTHQGIIRHTSVEDIKKQFLSLTVGTLIMVAGSFVKYFWYDNLFLFPTSIIVVEYFVCLFLLLMFRFTVKLIYLEGLKGAQKMTPTAIYGAGIYGVITKLAVEKELGFGSEAVCFIDDNKKKMGKTLEGLNIYHSSSLEQVIQKNGIKRLIVAIRHPEKANKKAVIETCLNMNVEILNVPPPSRWADGQFSSKQIRPINIDDLLGRESINLDPKRLKEEFQNKTILVTGAAGSIGSEIVRQLTEYSPKKVIILDQAESAVYDLESELQEKGVIHFTESVIADVRNLDRMENVFKQLRPDLVFHAAAYKHVPLMEDNPSEAILTNVLGTKTVVDLSIKYQVQKFVLISTDKAVNPASVMGCSKRIAEVYAQSANQEGSTRFVTTRFGNVLGSNGSVIPLFKKQIASGGPLTVTDPNITRFFMTITEACQLVLEASSMGKGGEIFVFDMGESVRIYDLAKKMIKLSGLVLDKDIKITITGLRPGEKLYEELLTNEENTIPTHHPQILIAKVRMYDFDEISRSISALTALFETQDNEVIVQQMKAIVPEFKSNNSVFEKLDK